jgi:cytochrome c oxidase accessory protein FixG
MNAMTDAVPVVDAQSTKAGGKRPFFAPRVPIYPRRVKGVFRSLKWSALVGLLGIYYLVPWIRWDRGPGVPDQATLIDMPSRRAYFFFIEIWPQEIYFLAALLIMAAIGLFFATAIVGRVWCGYACPQTVWTDLYMWVERRIEGDRNARIKLDKQPISLGKAAKKTFKHLVWLVIALFTGGAWIMYFNDAPTVLGEVFTGNASATVYGFIGLFTASTYLLAGWAREQVCTYMCPYARFQAAMFDEETLVVGYQGWRGEPRRKHKKGHSWEGRGHCVDCNQCVAVCPTGIDIRDGQQLECIGCALCIDACNNVMDKLDLPRGLIDYSTQSSQDARVEDQPYRYDLLRPRIVAYGIMLSFIAAIVLWMLAFRADVEVNVLRDRSPLFVTLADGAIRNGYTFKILNMARAPRDFTLTLDGVSQATMTVTGRATEAASAVMLDVKPDSVATFHVFVRVPGEAATVASMPLRFVLREAATGKVIAYDAVFRGPGE